jgi:hypothetical protein
LHPICTILCVLPAELCNLKTFKYTRLISLKKKYYTSVFFQLSLKCLKIFRLGLDEATYLAGLDEI